MDGGKLCLGLLPMPFVGNVRTASIFLLMLNPGARPHDFFGESEVKEYRTTLLATLRQDDGIEGLLDPRFAWHGRYGYWQGKLSKLFEQLAVDGNTYGSVRQKLQARMAALELVPYHSTRYALPNRLLGRLKSVQLMRSYVTDVLVPRPRRRCADHRWPRSEEMGRLAEVAEHRCLRRVSRPERASDAG